jgi:hypothetical protein
MMPARRAAPDTAFCTDASFRWWRRGAPPARVERLQRTREDPLPAPGLRCARELHRQRVRQPDSPQPLGQVPVVQRMGLGQLLLQPEHQVLRQHGHPILSPFAIAHQDLAPLEPDILHPKPQGLQQAHPRAVEERSHQPRGAAHLQQKLAHLGRGQDDRQAALGLGRDDLVQPRKLLAEHDPVQEEQCRLGLVLRGWRDAPVDCQVGQEGCHLDSAQFRRVTLGVEQNETPDPVDIGVLGAHRVVAHADGFAQAVEQARWCRGRGCFGLRIDARGGPG